MHRRVAVVGIDEGATAEPVADFAVELARTIGYSLRFVHAGEAVPDASDPLPAGAQRLRERVQERAERARLALQQSVERARTAGVESEGVQRTGRAPDVLMAEARTCGAELLVVGRAGAHGARILGSTTDRVLREAPCPVLVAADGAPEATAHLRRWLVAHDFTHASDAAWEFALRYRREGGVEPWVAHVVPPPAGEAVEQGLPSLAQATRARMREDAAAKLREVAPGLPATAYLVVESSDVADGLVEAARAHEAGLVVVGSHGRSRLGRIWLGSVAERLAAGPWPLLVVRASARGGGP
ncbi:MAG: universal stress protein [Myxococcota bacterium]|nr:universal stress protein [Myxococcota bacterium]MDW8363433.1 universal stress protein [Myxococcales bacterium]